MQSEFARAAIVGLWVLAVFMSVVAINVSSASHWIGLAGLLSMPPILVLAFRQARAQTLSASIQSRRR